MMSVLKAKHGNFVKKNSSEYFYNEESWQRSTVFHRLWFGSGCITLLIALVKSIRMIIDCDQSSNQFGRWIQPIFNALVGYVLADLGTGIYHWAIDNYGGPKTPVFGSQIEGFLRHHEHPRAITKRHIATKLHIQCAIFTIIVLPMNICCNDPNLLVFVSVFLGCGMFSQQFHSWSHTPKGKLPLLVVALQDARVVLPRSEHAAHHHAPFNTNYCIVSGVWNRFLDKTKFFLAMELMFYYIFGVKPRSWSDSNSYWTQISQISGMDPN